MKIYHFAFIFLLFQACTLSGEQEDRLNKQLSRYINAYNENRTLEVVALTDPKVVKHYKELGDSLFLVHFHQKENDLQTFLSNPIYREMKESSKSIQRKYWIEKYTISEEISDEYCIFAISEDGGENWFFALEEDYFNSAIQLNKRLFTKN
jgi:hypothetical protein